MLKNNNSNNNHVFVIGASAGGIETVRELLHLLPPDFPAPILLVIHTAADAPGLLARVLQRETKLLVLNAVDGAKLQPSRLYVAPPNFHLVIEADRMRLLKGPVENRHRPAIDPLFRSAARSLGPAAVGIILSGYLDDGCAGLFRIKILGGTTIVQDPEESLVPDMPRNAIERVDPDYIVSVQELAPLMSRLATREVAMTRSRKDIEMTADNLDDNIGSPSPQSCPECHGVLWETEEGGTLRFRCRVGHAFTADTMLEDQGVDVERALWAALRVLEENSELSTRLAEKARVSGRQQAEKRYSERASESIYNATLLRQLLTKGVQEPKPARPLDEALREAESRPSKTA
jgi:two-component system, chemotaxis family, protein-glutamate methylesterase/glutaminase